MYGLDCLLLDCESVKIVTQAWNCAFRWLYGVGKFTSTRGYFQSHGTMSMKFLLDSSLMSFYAGLLSSNNVLLKKLIMYSFSDKKIRSVFNSYDVYDCSDVCLIKHYVRLKFAEYCDNVEG